MTKKNKVRFLGRINDIDFFNYITDWKNSKVLDIGCGKGDLAYSLSDKGAHVFGLEPDYFQLNSGRNFSISNEVQFVNGSANSIPFVDNFFDYVIFCKSLHHVPCDLMNKALIESKRILNPLKGSLIVLEPCMDGEFSQLIKPFHDETHVRKKAAESLENFAIDSFNHFCQYTYTGTYKFKDFNSFNSKMSSATYNNFDLNLIDTPLVRKNFYLGKKDEIFVFSNPINVYIFFSGEKEINDKFF
tara:strand:- start:909 stop:1640 length:732 start_codon:yes stop_codon:yes gene_type:complete